NRAFRENFPALGAVTELDPLAVAGKDDLVIASDRTAAKGCKADPARLAGTADTVASAVARLREIDLPAFRSRFPEQKRGPGRGVDLVAVVHFDDLDVPG